MPPRRSQTGGSLPPVGAVRSCHLQPRPELPSIGGIATAGCFLRQRRATPPRRSGSSCRSDGGTTTQRGGGMGDGGGWAAVHLHRGRPGWSPSAPRCRPQATAASDTPPRRSGTSCRPRLRSDRGSFPPLRTDTPRGPVCRRRGWPPAAARAPPSPPAAPQRASRRTHGPARAFHRTALQIFVGKKLKTREGEPFGGPFRGGPSRPRCASPALPQQRQQLVEFRRPLAVWGRRRTRPQGEARRRLATSLATSLAATWRRRRRARRGRGVPSPPPT